MEEVKRTYRRGRTRISRKQQATIPVEAMRRAVIKPGDELVVQEAGAGRIVLVRADDLLQRHAGSLTGVYPADYLQQLRDEWK